MSYIPPHKRHSKDPDRPSPVPDSLVTKFKKKLHLKSSSSDKRNRIIYSADSISKWFLIGTNGIEDEIPPSAKLVPLSSDSVQCKKGEKPSILMNINDHKEITIVMSAMIALAKRQCIVSVLMWFYMNIAESEEKEERTKWLLIAEKILDDLVLAYERAKTAMDGENHHVLRLVASFGKIFFYGLQASPPMAEHSLKPWNRIFSTDVPTSYLHHIKSQLVSNHGFCIDVEKERYTVKVLVLYLIILVPMKPLAVSVLLKKMDGSLDLSLIRHMVVDVSCIDKNLDMRLMLSAKRKITDLPEKEISDIKELLDSARVDPNVKGGLRWPFGKSSSGDGYSVFESCHAKATVYKNQTLRLRTDRFNERIGTGEVKREVILMLKDMNTKLQEQNIDRGCVLEMLKDSLGTLWDFLHCEAYLT
ncbi:hypothetical protein Bca4012_017912 [Brassica carinata]